MYISGGGYPYIYTFWMNTDTLKTIGKYEGKKWLFNTSNFIKYGKWLRTIANVWDSQESIYFDFEYSNLSSKVSKLADNMETKNL